MGNAYPDGSTGSCSTCHTRHGFSTVEARKPAACASCHLGPDHPNIEIYNNSKHGHVFNAVGADWDFSKPANEWLPGDYRARVISGTNAKSSPWAPTVGDEVEFDFDSNTNQAGATRISRDFIQGLTVTEKNINENGRTVAADTEICRQK
jgi:hypothetical protein